MEPSNANPIPENNWAAPVQHLETRGIPSNAVNLNVNGRQLTGPLQGFGQLWQKTYKVRLSGAQVTPADVVRTWKRNFAAYWPKGNYFYAPFTEIQPGEVAVLNLAGPGGMTAPGGGPLISTGVMVIYADDESFSFMTPAGHMFSAMITFSAYDEEGVVAQVQALIRDSDPLYELGLRLGMIHKVEDDFWKQTLLNLANDFGVQGAVQQQVTCVDPRLQWSQAKNVWHNAALRTMIHMPALLLKRLVSPGR